MSCTRAISLIWFCLALAVGCGDRTATDTEQADSAGVGEPTAADPSILPRPFSADQIRDEMIVGFSVEVSQATPDGVVLTRWTVLAADEDGVEIEYATLDADGGIVGENEVERSGWVELRDHATFPAATSVRTEVSRETALGTLDGWLYTVRDDEAGTVTEYFFARDLPGAPVHMQIVRGDEVVMEMAQQYRRRPQ